MDPKLKTQELGWPIYWIYLYKCPNKKKMTNGLMDLFSTQMFYDFLHFNPYNTLNIRERSIYKLKLNSFVSSSVKEHK